jgi:hypothetical protein
MDHRRDRPGTAMEEDQRKIIGEVYQMKVIRSPGQRNEIQPIEWTPYTGETVIINTIIRKGKNKRDCLLRGHGKAVPQAMPIV